MEKQAPYGTPEQELPSYLEKCYRIASRQGSRRFFDLDPYTT